jgi:predicted ester cyclase
MDQASLIKTAGALFDAMTAHDLSLWERVLGPDFRADYPGAQGLDRAQARAYNAPFFETFPDLRMHAEKVVVQGATAVLDGVAAGTFRGPLKTPSGMVPPNGRSGSIRIVLIAQVEGGKLVRERTVWDQLDLLTQLGLVPGA